VQAPGKVSFFLYFDTREHAEHAHALLASDGFAAQDVLPPDDPALDTAWSVAADRVLAPDDLEGALARVREIAAAAGGELDAVSMPWPDHPAGFAPRRRS
jgi:hypothetical protein